MLRPDEGITIKLLSGTILGVDGPVKNQMPILYAHLILSPGRTWSTSEIPKGWTTLAYVLSGNGSVSNSDPLGEPLKEPEQRMGPFVMNTKRELEEAYDDYMAGRMGAIEGKRQR